MTSLRFKGGALTFLEKKGERKNANTTVALHLEFTDSSRALRIYSGIHSQRKSVISSCSLSLPKDFPSVSLSPVSWSAAEVLFSAHLLMDYRRVRHYGSLDPTFGVTMVLHPEKFLLRCKSLLFPANLLCCANVFLHYSL